MFSSVNTCWTLVGAFLVYFMQAGFALCEAGFTRAKNTGNILMKNMMDFFIRINRITISAGASGLLLSFCSAAVSCIMPQKASFSKTFFHKLPDFT